MSNSKTLDAERKHRHKRKAAKEKVRQYLAHKRTHEELPALAREYLARHLRVTKKR